MNKIVKYKWQKKDITLTFEDVKQLIATSPNVTDKEIENFMNLCLYRGLNPFLKEAYLIKYGNEPAKQVVSKDVMDARVEADERFDGEEITHNYKRGMDLNDFWMRGRIYRKGCSRPVADVTVYYPEYVGKKKDGTITRMWATKEFTMLQKVCKAQMKRESNPRDLAGMYLAEEYDQEVKPTEEEIKNINPIPKNNNNNEEMTTDEPLENLELATQPQKDEIYGIVICEKCGTRVYGFRCPKCKNIDLHVMKKGFYHSHFMTKDDFDVEMKPTMLPDKLTKIEAIKIWDWWRGDKEGLIIGERTKREAKEKQEESAESEKSKEKPKIKEKKSKPKVEEKVEKKETRVKPKKTTKDLEELFHDGEEIGLSTWVELIGFAVKKDIFEIGTSVEDARVKLLANDKSCYDSLVDFIDISKDVDNNLSEDEQLSEDIPF